MFATIVVCGAWGLSGCDHGTRDTHSNSASVPSAEFSALDRPGRRDDLPTRQERSQIPAAAATQFGLAFRHARRVRAEPSIEVFLVPGERGLCVLVIARAGGFGACRPTEKLTDGKLLVIEPRARVMLGVVPDGVSRVTVAASTGTVTVPAVENVFLTRIRTFPRSVTYVGKMTRTLRLPADLM